MNVSRGSKGEETRPFEHDGSGVELMLDATFEFHPNRTGIAKICPENAMPLGDDNALSRVASTRLQISHCDGSTLLPLHCLNRE